MKCSFKVKWGGSIERGWFYLVSLKMFFCLLNMLLVALNVWCGEMNFILLPMESHEKRCTALSFEDSHFS